LQAESCVPRETIKCVVRFFHIDSRKPDTQSDIHLWLWNGIKGAAIATLIARLVYFSIAAWYFLKGNSILKLKRRHFRIDFGSLREILTVGSPHLLMFINGIFLMIIWNNSIVHYGNEQHLAISSILQQIIMFVFFPVSGIMAGMQPIIGFNYGAKKMERVTGVLKLATLSSFLILSAFFLFLMSLPALTISLFTREKDMIIEAVPLLRIWILCIPLYSFSCMATALFQALGSQSQP
jgi:Na+-driven multidrug efflux pump